MLLQRQLQPKLESSSSATRIKVSTSFHRSVDGDHPSECDEEMDRVEVYLRLKPVAPGEIDISEIQNDKTVIIDPQLGGQR